MSNKHPDMHGNWVDGPDDDANDEASMSEELQEVEYAREVVKEMHEDLAVALSVSWRLLMSLDAAVIDTLPRGDLDVVESVVNDLVKRRGY